MEGNYPVSPAAQPGAPPVENEDSGNTGLLPKSLVADAQVGATVTLKIVAVYDDEVEVAKASAAPPKAMDQATAELDQMAAEE